MVSSGAGGVCPSGVSGYLVGKRVKGEKAVSRARGG